MLVLNNFGFENGKPLNNVVGYFVMPKYSICLADHLERQNSVDILDLLHISSQLIDAYEIVHTAGRTFNDLKPCNIMLEQDQ